MEHLASWWPHRGQPFVLFVHYADLQHDLAGEMRRIAAFLGIDVPEQLWPDVVERCTLEAMRNAHATSKLQSVFEGGAATFFNEGTSGRWRDVVPEHLVRRSDDLAASQLPPEANEWIHRGSLALEWRP
jgi:hypothetical protein